MKAGALAKYLASLGYGSRRDVMEMIARGRVTSRAGAVLVANDACEHAHVLVDGEPLDPPHGVVLMLHKPVGYVCSTKDANPLVYDLVPPRFVHRSPIIAPIGRLDAETSGLLLMTDDGPLNHLITAPRSHVPKVYDVTLASTLRGDEAEMFGSGTLLLKSEDAPLKPAALEVIDERRARVTLREGRYHQVRRMFAAVGNRVESLHRSSVGGITLGELPAGHWRMLKTEEVASLQADIARLRSDPGV